MGFITQEELHQVNTHYFMEAQRLGVFDAAKGLYGKAMKSDPTGYHYAAVLGA